MHAFRARLVGVVSAVAAIAAVAGNLKGW